MLAAVRDLAWSDGLAAVSIDEVARRSGVAKTTLYRHFGTKQALLVAALDDLIEPPTAPDTGSLERDLVALLESVLPIFRDRDIRALSLEIAAAAARDAALDELFGAFFGGRMGPLLSVVERAVARGELAPGLEPEVAIEIIEGPLIARSMIDPARLDDVPIEQLAERAAVELRRAAPPTDG